MPQIQHTPEFAFSPSADKIIGTFRAIDDARKAAAQALDWGIPSRSV